MDFLITAFNQSGVFAKLSLMMGFGPPGVAIAFLVRPGDRTLAVLRPVSLASIFAGVAGLTVGLIAVLMGVANTTPESTYSRNVYIGLAEALVPLFFNFALLSVAWLLVAFGMLRRPRVE